MNQGYSPSFRKHFVAFAVPAMPFMQCSSLFSNTSVIWALTTYKLSGNRKTLWHGIKVGRVKGIANYISVSMNLRDYVHGQN